MLAMLQGARSSQHHGLREVERSLRGRKAMNPYRPTVADRLEAAYATWFKWRWPTGWGASYKLDSEQIMRDAFEGGYLAGLDARAAAQAKPSHENIQNVGVERR